MVSIIILLFLIFGYFIGLKRGFVMQVIHLFSFIISFIVASLYFRKLAQTLSLWIPYPDLAKGTNWAFFLNSDPLENAFYNAISFAIIFFGIKIILQIIASMLHIVVSFPIIKTINKWAGGVLGFIEVYLILFVILYILALVPLAGLQSRIDRSSLASLMVEHTPFLSKGLKSMWFTDLLSIINF